MPKVLSALRRPTPRTLFSRVGTVVAVAVVTVVVAAGTAYAGDTPVGFWYGSDLGGPPPSGSGVEYTMPNCDGGYGSYVGRINSVPDPGYNYPTYSDDAAQNAYAGYGIGPTSIRDLEGPGDGGATTSSEAVAYGESQALNAINNFITYYDNHDVFVYPIIWADAEVGNGGYSTGTKSLDRDVLTGFNTEIRQLYGSVVVRGVSYHPYVGIYSSPSFWNSYMSGTLTTMYEWSPVVSYASYTTGDCASGWSATGTGHVADFYAGYTSSSSCALMWQWISGTSDYDQLYRPRLANNSTCT